jgi:ComF family protein
MLTIPNFFKPLWAWLLPTTCILCHYPAMNSQDLCLRCKDELPMLPQSCPGCAKILAQDTPAEVYCGTCLKDTRPFDKLFALFAYEPPITKLLMELKFHEKLINARVLGELMSVAIKDSYRNAFLPEIIIPMPLHSERLRERGFNQAMEIARPLSQHLGIPLDKTSCIRVKNTAAQATLPAKARRKNIKNAFKINDNLRNKSVAVVDDIMTTGQTLIEFSKALKKARVGRIDIWCCARTVF